MSVDGKHEGERTPFMLDGFYLTGYHNNPVKIGDRIRLTFNTFPVTDGKDIRTEIVKVLDIRQQLWDGSDAFAIDSHTSKSGKLQAYNYVLTETIPSYKNYVKVQFLSEERDNKIDQILNV